MILEYGIIFGFHKLILLEFYFTHIIFMYTAMPKHCHGDIQLLHGAVLWIVLVKHICTISIRVLLVVMTLI